jgi:uncharacterized membrane protein YhaH (DUF805 family)
MEEGKAAGWHADPSNDKRSRYWNGYRWTEQVRLNGAEASVYRASAPTTQPVREDPYTPYPFGGTDKKADERYVGFFQGVALGFKGYAKFRGRSSRSEYWWWFLFGLLAIFVPGIVAGIALTRRVSHQCHGAEFCQTHLGALPAVLIVIFLFSLVLVLPTISILVRRLHDTERSGHWAWMFYLAPWAASFIPFIGGFAGLGFFIWQCVWAAGEGTIGPNSFGRGPNKGRARAARVAGVELEPVRPGTY